VSAGERTLDRAEELALDEFTRQGGTVDFDDPAFAARAKRMDQIRTVTSLGAMRSTVRTRSRIAALWKTGEAVPLMVSRARRKLLFSAVCSLRSKAQRMSVSSLVFSKGLVTKL
jgi:hypothetical protein